MPAHTSVEHFGEEARQRVSVGFPRTIRRVNLCFGLSFAFLFGLIVLWGGIPVSKLVGLDMGGTIKLWSLPMFFAIAVALLLAMTLNQCRSVGAMRTAPAISGLLCAVGLLVLYYSNQGSGGFLLVILSGLCTGFGYGVLLLGWINQLTSFSEPFIAKELMGSLAVSIVFYFVARLLAAGEAFLFVSVGLSFASSFLLWTRRKNLRSLSGGMSFGMTGVKVVLGELREPIVCVSALAAVVSLTRYAAITSVSNSALFDFATHGSALVVSATLYVLLRIFGNKGTVSLGHTAIPAIYRVAFPVIATLLLLASAFGHYVNIVVAAVAFVVFLIVSICTMHSAQSIARRHRVWPPLVYGLIAGSMYGSFALVMSLRSLWTYPAVKSDGASLTVIVILAFYVLAMSFFILQGRLGHMKGVAASAADDKPVVVVVEETAFKCELLAKEFGLTQREREVMVLMAKGRDVPSIAQQLFVSANTVRSHSKNIYKKLNIHSKAELFNLLDGLPAVDERLNGGNSGASE